jgi:hypothetical protein
MLKNLILILLVVGLSGCSLSRFFVKNDDATPTPTPKQQLTYVSPEMVQFNQRFYEDLKARLKKSAQDKGLSPLAEASLAKDAIEVRFYMFADFYGPSYKGYAVEESILAMKKDGSGWSAKIVRNVLKDSDKKEKMTENLPQPASGWDNLWQQLQNEGVLAKAELAEPEVKTSSRLYVIESKVNGTYNYVYFHQPKEKTEIPEEQRIAKLFNLIAKELGVSDVKAS